MTSTTEINYKELYEQLKKEHEQLKQEHKEHQEEYEWFMHKTENEIDELKKEKEELKGIYFKVYDEATSMAELIYSYDIQDELPELFCDDEEEDLDEPHLRKLYDYEMKRRKEHLDFLLSLVKEGDTLHQKYHDENKQMTYEEWYDEYKKE